MKKRLLKMALILGATLPGALIADPLEKTSAPEAPRAMDEQLATPVTKELPSILAEALAPPSTAGESLPADTGVSAALPSQRIATPQAAPFGHSGTHLVEPEPMGQWLGEVRAQRRLWEQRRRAAKEAMDARRRWIDPQGAAQRQLKEQEIQQRRDAFLEKIERDREAFLNRGPWRTSPAPRQEGPLPGENLWNRPDDGNETAPAPDAEFPHLPGWNNPWYYRGF